MTKDLGAYKKNGYNYTHVAFVIDVQGQLGVFEVGYKKTLERKIANCRLTSDCEILTFKQAAKQYPQFFVINE